MVTEYIRSLIGSNAPLAAGMGVAAREELRRRNGWTAQRSTRTAIFGLMGLIGLAMAFGIALDPNGLRGPLGFLQAALLIAIVLGLVRQLCFRRDQRLKVYLALESRLAQGSSISSAMASLPRFFPRHLVDLISIGEETGTLDGPLAQFNDGMLRTLDRSRQLRWVFRYVAFVFSVQCLLLSFLIVKVLPVFVEMTEEVSEEGAAPLPHLKQAATVAHAFDYVVYFWPQAAMTGALLLVLYTIIRIRARRLNVRGALLSPLLLIPWFRFLIVRQNLGLIALMLHGLLRGGVPLDRALVLCANADLPRAYRRWLLALRESLREGESLRDALARNQHRWLVPDSFVGLMEAGEYAGQLPAMLARTADLYQQETEKRMQILVSAVLPLGIFFLGYITLSAELLAFKLIWGMAEALLV